MQFLSISLYFNVVCLATGSTCHLQCVGETAQQLNVSVGKHWNCFKGKVNSGSVGGFPIIFPKVFAKALNMQLKSLKSQKWREELTEEL